LEGRDAPKLLDDVHVAPIWNSLNCCRLVQHVALAPGEVSSVALAWALAQVVPHALAPEALDLLEELSILALDHAWLRCLGHLPLFNPLQC
jgi:hypothetical protein